MKEKKKMTLKEYLSYIGIRVGVAAVVLGEVLWATDSIRSSSIKKGSGLPLVYKGAHISGGKHKVVLTDQFCKLLSYETRKEAQKLVIDSMNLAYKNLNELCTGVKFEFCTTSDEYAKEFNILKVEGFGIKDIPLYLTTDDIDRDKYILASTHYSVLGVSMRLWNESITFKKDAMLTLWNDKGSLEEILNPLNTYAYTLTAHETMHLMGFDHIENDSIMGTYIDINYKDFTESDKKMIDKFNVQFYGNKVLYPENMQEKELEL